MANWFSFAGVTSTAKGVYVQDFPPATLPEERAEFVDVPGRSGSLTVLEGDAVYDDIILTINCYVRDMTQLDAISAWLRGSGELVLGNMPDRYYVARCVNQIEIAKLLRASGHRTFAVVFRCQPYRYIHPPVAAYALDVTVKTVATQAGSGTPSPVNVRPISGKASVTVRRSGANMLNLTAFASKSSFIFVGNDEIGIANPTGSGAIIYGGLLRDGVTYTLSAKLNNSAAFGVRADLYPDSYQELLNLSAGQTGTVTFTVPAGFEAAGGVLRFYVTGAASGNASLSQIQLVLGNSAPAYQPYTGKEYTLTPDAPIYGRTGAEDEIGSDGHVTRKTKVITLTELDPWITSSTVPAAGYLHYITLADGKLDANQELMCSHFAFTTNAFAAMTDNQIRANVQSGGTQFVISVATSMNLATFKAWLVGKNVQVRYDLATPATATVAPVHIYSATGTDTITSDATVTEYTFGAVESILLTAPADIVNPGTAEAIPKITVVGSGDIDLTIGGRAIHIDGLASAITIDCETGMAKEGSGGDLSADLTGTVSLDYYPWTIQPGTNAVAWTGSVTSVTITPAWRYV